jgi:hypothetical protein
MLWSVFCTVQMAGKSVRDSKLGVGCGRLASKISHYF